jgi:hypothetical protein
LVSTGRKSAIASEEGNMKRRILMTALLSALMVSAVPATASASQDSARRIEVVHARMTGDQEVPGPVDTTGKGRAVFIIDHESETVRYIVMATRIDRVTESHIHLAAAGANGPPVVFLFDFDDTQLNIGSATEGTTKGFVAHGTITEHDLLETVSGLTMAGLIEALTSGGAYVNVHTLDFRPGEIRGQIG